ncbi:hypothetical protein ATANTOWER_032137 [Ataeniobius toweri]|uniref:Uncharacterized protein n=1 Tax=Ataeniobius toweri TaxID=208326 RepID=A0ABU7ALW5_9TELE|nr:hypothetical protein [Ataeniobius toweri]
MKTTPEDRGIFEKPGPARTTLGTASGGADRGLLTALSRLLPGPHLVPAHMVDAVVRYELISARLWSGRA